MRTLTALPQITDDALQGFLNVLYPPRCALCEASLEHDRQDEHRFVCAGCLARIERITSPWCGVCGGPLTHDEHDLCARCAHQQIPFALARSFGPYEGELARLIQLLKYHGERALAQDLAALLMETLTGEGLEGEIAGITFVPMSPKRARARGFNQAELLARHLGRRIGVPVFPALRKTRETPPQEALSRPERLLSLVGAFAPQGRPARCGSVLLVDDVYTTGATVVECSRALKAAGYERVFVVTLARTPRSPRSQLDDENEETDDVR